MNTWKTIWLLFLLGLSVWGCAGVDEKYPSKEAKTFFSAAREANFLGVQCMTPNQVDLSAYTPLMGVKYPPTTSVDVLSEPPSRPYQAFAVLQGDSASAGASQNVAPAVLAQLTTKGKAIGADAIILRRPPDTAPAAKAEAVAIKYCLENPSK